MISPANYPPAVEGFTPRKLGLPANLRMTYPCIVKPISFFAMVFCLPCAAPAGIVLTYETETQDEGAVRHDETFLYYGADGHRLNSTSTEEGQERTYSAFFKAGSDEVISIFPQQKSFLRTTFDEVKLRTGNDKPPKFKRTGKKRIVNTRPCEVHEWKSGLSSWALCLQKDQGNFDQIRNAVEGWKLKKEGASPEALGGFPLVAVSGNLNGIVVEAVLKENDKSSTHRLKSIDKFEPPADYYDVPKDFKDIRVTQEADEKLLEEKLLKLKKQLQELHP
jgi:hypothetical protein